MELRCEQVLAWRVRRSYLARQADPGVVAVARRLCGLQAQVPSCAEQAVAARSPGAEQGLVGAALAERRLVRTWAMRGTLHALPVDLAADCLALMAAARTWEKASWQKTFLPADTVAAVAAAAWEALAGGALTREELTARVVDAVGDPALAEHLGSAWGVVLKPLAWQGVLCNGPASGGRVTFARPDVYLPEWPGLPDPAEAGPRVVLAYLDAYGPATEAAFDEWLIRGVTPKRSLRAWFGALADAGLVTRVSVEGEPRWARTDRLDELAGARPLDDVRLLPAFDPYVLGPGTKDPHLLDPARRGDVSRAGGWIAPVVVAGGRVTGTWEAAEGAVRVSLFPGEPPVDPAAEAAHLNPGLPVEVVAA